MAEGGYCAWCGRPADTCAGGCRRWDNTVRFCPTCGQRLRVLVTPMRVEASCRDHGPVPAG